MSAKGRPTYRQRLEGLTEKALAQAEQKAAAGEPVTATELNGIRRLVDAAEARREQDEQLERLNALTRSP